MRECLIIGKPNAGKSLFFVNFARYLGVTHFRLGPEKPPLAAARAAEELVKPAPHYTRRLFRVILPAPSRDGPITVLTDSVGLTDHAAAAAEIRKAMAETLRAFRGAAIILHIVDVTAAAGSPAAPGPVDRELAQVASRKAGYALLANKMDLPGAREGLKSLGRLQLPGPVIAVSALAGSGFPEVRHFLLRG
ncbi:MAG TPA: GTPase domain-containing protein [Bacillota bacterium]|nr:GTPase domain-containing protein [Bacillota bacterium]